MRTVLPALIIHTILALSVSAEDAVPNPPSRADICPTETEATEVITTPLTLWDLGFSLKHKWADLREQEECPVPPNLICIDGDAECGDQQVLEDVASSLHPSETASAEGSRVTPAGSVDETEGLVSFEDWKKKKLAEDEEEGEQDQHSRAPDSTSSDTGSEGRPTAQAQAVANNETSETGTAQGDNSSAEKATEPVKATVKTASDTGETPKAHAHNKYNYASPDCSARIHSSSPQTQHASSLLHKSRDRYMLTPCKAGEHWVVIELCDEIRIEAVEVAVWEFFSGVVRDVRVSVGGAEDADFDEDDDDGERRGTSWEDVGSFVGRNVRGVQTYTLPQPTSFHRFVRLDFPSFYGTEYYCPVSQVKVYGMNQMEAFKWEQKRQAASAKDRDREKSSKDREAEERRAREKAETEERVKEQIRIEDQKREQELDELEKLVFQQARLARQSPELTSLPKDLPTIEIVTVTASSFTTTSSASALSATANTSRAGSNGTDGVADANGTSTAVPVDKSNTSVTTSVSASSSSKSPSPRSDTSESIYAHIVRRLNALEGNSSLVARYIEEQAKVMRTMLGRVERGWEDWRLEREYDELGRWEQERMRQEDRLGQVISQMEQQRIAMDVERKAILSELRVLSDELGYERRRGIAQLLITLVLIGIGAATRSSTIDAVLKPLMAEARRRRSVYKSISGPLSGLAIDMGTDRPPAIIGQPRSATSPDSPLKAPWSTSTAKPVKRSNSGRRPATPSRRRHQPNGQAGPHARVFSDSAPFAGNDASLSPFMSLALGPKSPKPRGSLPPARANGATRKLARSAHLHSIDADRVRREVRARMPDHAVNGEGESTPRRNQSSYNTPGPVTFRTSVSPLSTDEAIMSDGPDVPSDIDMPSDWGTDAEGSVSGIDDALHQDSDTVDKEVVRELIDIWSPDDRPEGIKN